LEPKTGLYDEFVMMLDFNSLYPSIIQEYNICFTTVDRPTEDAVAKCDGEADLLSKTHLPDGLNDEEGILPGVLRRLVESRRNVKAMIKNERDEKVLKTLEIRQKALKLTANSMYGCLGFQNSRFYAKPLAAMITAKGREALQSTINIVNQECQLDVVYGDTDSVFVNTKTCEYDQAMQVAQQIKKSVNKRYKRLEIELDGVFGRLLLLKKKKYAGLKVVDWQKRTFEKEVKGLDIVRRDWCGLSKDLGQAILDQVLGCENKEKAVEWIHGMLTEQGKEMDDGKIALERYVITKGLTKPPQDYPDAKHQPHVLVALRMMQRGVAVTSGQEIPFVICEWTGDGPKANWAERARHPAEFSQDATLRPDIAWYKSQQVHPPIMRLLGPVEGTDAARLAECLGMEGGRFAQAAAAGSHSHGLGDSSYLERIAGDINALLDRKERWKSFASDLPGVDCAKCGEKCAWRKLLQPDAWDAQGVNALFRCACGERINPRRAQNLFVMQLKAMLRRHMEGWVQCTDEVCMRKTRRLCRGGRACAQPHCGGSVREVLDDNQLLQELEFVQYLCSGASTGYAGEDVHGCRKAAIGMERDVRRLLECNGYNRVDCGQLFGAIFGSARPTA
jgi:DNA polymerase alpha subunit A